MRPGLNPALSKTPAQEPANWVFSPEPHLERILGDLRKKHPPASVNDPSRVRNFLAGLGDPHLRLPPVFHAAGTNGKGSTLAFLQAVFEAGGLSVHKFISPHLVRFEERIVINGKNIEGELLESLIGECNHAAEGRALSFFEYFTGLAFLAYSRIPADALLLETGLGGENDATNVLEKHAVSLFTRISYDHTQILGKTLAEIARHKAGIMRKNCPAVMAPQQDFSAADVFRGRAAELGISLYESWKVSTGEEGFSYEGEKTFHLPKPYLQGAHQVINAGTAIAALEKSAAFSYLLTQEVLEKAMRDVRWQGRLQKLTRGPLVDLLPQGGEIWLDGAHNDSGAEILAAQAGSWNDGKPLCVVTAHKQKKDVSSFYEQLMPHAEKIVCVEPGFDAPMQSAQELCDYLTSLGCKNAMKAENLESAVSALAFASPSPPRILVTGSLYLVGYVLRHNA